MPRIKYTTSEQIEEMRNELKKEKEKLGLIDTIAITNNVQATSYSHKSKSKRILRISGTITFSIVVIFLSTILISVLVAKSKGETPNLFGMHLYVVESGSMEPTLKIGNVILSKKVDDKGNLTVGTIVTFKTTQGATVTHRIIELVYDEKNKVSYRTKGDNPINSPDIELLTPDRVVATFIAKIPLT